MRELLCLVVLVMAAPSWAADVVRFLASTEPGAVVAVCGMPRTGKSRALKLYDAHPSLSRRVVFDPYAARDLRLYRLKEEPAPPWGGTWCSPAELVRWPGELIDSAPCKVVVVPPSLAPEGLGRDFSRVARVLWDTGRVDLVAEEAGLYSRWAVPLVMQLASGGGHARMRLFLVSQSFSRLAVDARRHVSHLVSFAQGSAEDLEALGKRAGRGFADRVRALRPGEAPATWRLGEHSQSREVATS